MVPAPTDEKQIAIGEGHWIRFCSAYSPDKYAVLYGEGKVVGIIERHLRADDGQICEGYVQLSRHMNDDPLEKIWDVVQWEPLTLSPSIMCTACGMHGYIRDGKWHGVLDS